MIIVYICYAIIFASQLLLISSNQLAHGAVYLACFLTFFICQTIAFRDKSSSSSYPGSAPFLFFLGFMVLQILPLPPEWLSTVSPVSSDIYSETVWGVDANIWMPVAVDTRSTVQGIFKLSAFFVFYLLASQVSLYESVKCLTTITFISAIVFLVGIWAQKTGTLFTVNNVLLEKLTMEYVILLEDSVIAVIVVISPLVYSAFKISDQKAVNFPLKKTRHYYRGALFALVFCVVLISGSLAIWSAVFLSIVSWGAIFVIRRLARVQTLQLAGFLFIVALAGLYMCSSGLSSQMFWHWDEPLYVNPKLSSMAQPTIHGGYITSAGTGFDTLDRVMFFSEPDRTFFISQPSKLLQVVAEFGLVGTALLLWFGFNLLRKTPKNWKKSRNKTALYTFAGAFASLQTYLFLATATPYTGYSAPILYLALALSFMTSVSKNLGTKTSVSQRIGASKRGWSGLMLLILCIYFGGELCAGMIFPLVGSDKSNTDQIQATGLDRNWIDVAVKSAPLNHSRRQSLIDFYHSKNLYDKAVKHSTILLRLNPLSEGALLSAGMIYDVLDDNKKTDLLMQASLKARPASNNGHIRRINRLLSKGMQRQAIKYTYYVLNLHPEKTKEYLSLLDLYDVPQEEKRSAIPKKSYAYFVYAKALLSQDKRAMADIYFMEATMLASREVHPNSQIYLTYIAHLERENHLEDALDVALQGQEVFPYNAEFAYKVAKLYERTGIKYRALEEYRKALLLDPRNKLTGKRIDLLQNR